mmetsp:Transcript_16071/g.36318  ORF Transcript_16071/g.36318 Transcript_16071/m.36318 type:complete len:218 (+) Transcript_16071:119-772(+)
MRISAHTARYGNTLSVAQFLHSVAVEGRNAAGVGAGAESAVAHAAHTARAAGPAGVGGVEAPSLGGARAHAGEGGDASEVECLDLRDKAVQLRYVRSDDGRQHLQHSWAHRGQQRCRAQQQTCLPHSRVYGQNLEHLQGGEEQSGCSTEVEQRLRREPLRPLVLRCYLQQRDGQPVERVEYRHGPAQHSDQPQGEALAAQVLQHQPYRNLRLYIFGG